MPTIMPSEDPVLKRLTRICAAGLVALILALSLAGVWMIYLS